MYKIPDKVSSFLWYFVKRQRCIFTLLLLSSMVVPLSNSLWPYITGNLVDTLSALENERSFSSKLINAIAIMFVFWILNEVLQRVKGYILAYVIPKLEANIRIEVFKYVSQHSYSYFLKNYVGGIANRISDLPKASASILEEIFTVFAPLVISILLSSYLFLEMNVTLSALLFVWLTGYTIMAWLFGYKAAHYSKVQSEAKTRVQGKIVDSIANHLNVKMFTALKREVDELAELQNDQRTKYQFSLVFIEHIKFILGIWNILNIAIIFYLTMNLWHKGDITTGNVVFVVNSILNLVSLIIYVSDEVTYLYKEIGICEQGLKVVQDPLSKTEEEENKELVVTKGSIELDNVSFHYKYNTNIFNNLSMHVEGGQKIGLVGFSGSGKTTFANLVMRLYDVTSGSIKIDGQDIREVSVQSLRKNISIIPQEPVLFHRSIIDNIRYGRPDATDEEVISAAKRAFCHDFIVNLHDGYNFQVGERGGNISGGQRQRIAIARAIIKRAPIVIMDEATSALDAETEIKIQKSIDYLMQGRTVLVIAHKLATLMNMDKILVFDKGTIVEEGTHEELIRKNGHYAKLWRMQVDGSLPR